MGATVCPCSWAWPEEEPYECALESAMLSLLAAGGSRPKLSIKCNGELGRRLSSEVLALQAGGPELASPAST